MKRLFFLMVIVSLTCTFTFGQKKSKKDKKKYQRPRIVAPENLDRTDPVVQTDPQTLADAKWFEVFKDEKLQALIREALTYNYDLREAVARIDGARASLGITKSDQYPKIGASADVV